uniref:Uncharacterized protein n=1 Tax=Plectus sambesii TaxID=2011161 RepID=A0A914VQB4_9BILA
MSLLPFEVDKRTIVEVEAVRTYNTANQWRATAVKRAKNHQDSNSSPEIKFSAISQLLCTASRCKTADMLIDQMQPRNVFAGASDLWTFVNSNPQLFSTRADLICMRSVEHIESFVQLVNALGPGSFSLSLLGDTLIDECKQFWMSAYGFDQRNRLFGFLYDHIELFEVLIEFPDPLHNEIKLSGTPYLPTLVQLEDMKAAQDIKISPAPSSLSLTEEVMMRTSDCETISDEDESEVEATAGYSCINDAPVAAYIQCGDVESIYYFVSRRHNATYPTYTNNSAKKIKFFYKKKIIY